MRHRATALVINDNKILLMFRRKVGREYWVFPGGGIEPDEMPDEGAAREVEEETTVLVKPGRLVYLIKFDDGIVNRFFLCEYLNGEPKLGLSANEGRGQSVENFYEPRWVDISDLPDLLLFPLEVRDWLIVDLKNNFSDNIRDENFIINEMRKE